MPDRLTRETEKAKQMADAQRATGAPQEPSGVLADLLTGAAMAAPEGGNPYDIGPTPEVMAGVGAGVDAMLGTREGFASKVEPYARAAAIGAPNNPRSQAIVQSLGDKEAQFNTALEHAVSLAGLMREDEAYETERALKREEYGREASAREQINVRDALGGLPGSEDIPEHMTMARGELEALQSTLLRNSTVFMDPAQRLAHEQNQALWAQREPMLELEGQAHQAGLTSDIAGAERDVSDLAATEGLAELEAAARRAGLEGQIAEQGLRGSALEAVGAGEEIPNRSGMEALGLAKPDRAAGRAGAGGGGGGGGFKSGDINAMGAIRDDLLETFRTTQYVDKEGNEVQGAGREDLAAGNVFEVPGYLIPKGDGQQVFVPESKLTPELRQALVSQLEAMSAQVFGTRAGAIGRVGAGQPPVPPTPGRPGPPPR